MSLDLDSEYINGISTTINCTATNPNTTKVFLIGKTTNAPFVIQTNDETTFVESANENGCNPNVRVVYQAANLDWTDIDSLACMVEDKYYGKNFTSEFKYPTIIRINWLNMTEFTNKIYATLKNGIRIFLKFNIYTYVQKIILKNQITVFNYVDDQIFHQAIKNSKDGCNP